MLKYHFDFSFGFDPFILSKIKTHKTIASFFKQINFYWMVLYAILLIINLLFYIQISFILHCHYINKELAHNGVFYIINSFIFNSILFIDSVVAIYNFLKGQPIYNCLSEFNIQIEFAFILLLIYFVICLRIFLEYSVILLL